MTATEFVSNWLELRSDLLKDFLEGESEIASQLQSLELSPKQNGILSEAINGILRDTMYTLLLGLDGCASIGSSQQSYTLFDENGKLVYEPGQLEGEAWQLFHGNA